MVGRKWFAMPKAAVVSLVMVKSTLPKIYYKVEKSIQTQTCKEILVFTGVFKSYDKLWCSEAPIYIEFWMSKQLFIYQHALCHTMSLILYTVFRARCLYQMKAAKCLYWTVLLLSLF